tara:strand:- start:590 stop:778 length:189 start_codon:yes stop_codon:yes gene_type:complete
MIQSALVGLVLKAVKKELINGIVEKIKPLEKYVHEENELDKELKDIKVRLSAVEGLLTNDNT